ncbi:hypothetical protein GCM10009603_27740 [Nocardiopsis exhalans]
MVNPASRVQRGSGRTVASRGQCLRLREVGGPHPEQVVQQSVLPEVLFAVAAGRPLRLPRRVLWHRSLRSIPPDAAGFGVAPVLPPVLYMDMSRMKTVFIIDCRIQGDPRGCAAQ